MDSNELQSVFELAKAIGYAKELGDIHCPTLFLQALTHRSYAHQHPEAYDNELLEFLGDELLGESVTRILMRKRSGLTLNEKSEISFVSDNDEDFFSRTRIHLVEGRNLAKVARNIGLGEYLRVSDYAEKQGIRENDNMLENALEALIAAVAIDTTFETVQQLNLDNSIPEIEWDFINYRKVDEIVSALLETDKLLAPGAKHFPPEKRYFEEDLVTEEDLLMTNPKVLLNHLYTKGRIERPEFGVVSSKTDEFNNELWKSYCKVGFFCEESSEFHIKKRDAELDAAKNVLKKLVGAKYCEYRLE